MRLSNAYSHAVAAQTDWQGFLVNPNFNLEGSSLTWPNRESFLRLGAQADLVLRLSENKQYSFQIGEDGSMIQLFYNFHHSTGKLLNASLGFYHAAGFEFHEEDPEVEEIYGLEAYDSFDQVSWLRMDFAPSQARNYLHHHCHLHLSLSPDIRIPVSRVPTPRQFIELIAGWFYPKELENRRLTGDEYAPLRESVSEILRSEVELGVEIPTLGVPHFIIPNG